MTFAELDSLVVAVYINGKPVPVSSLSEARAKFIDYRDNGVESLGASDMKVSDGKLKLRQRSTGVNYYLLYNARLWEKKNDAASIEIV